MYYSRASSLSVVVGRVNSECGWRKMYEKTNLVESSTNGRAHKRRFLGTGDVSLAHELFLAPNGTN